MPIVRLLYGTVPPERYIDAMSDSPCLSLGLLHNASIRAGQISNAFLRMGIYWSNPVVSYTGLQPARCLSYLEILRGDT